MTPQEWAMLSLEIQTRWPNRSIPEESFSLWYGDLAELPAEQVKAGIEALYRDGREWAPNGAQIRLKVIDLASNLPTHGEAYGMAMEAAGPRGGFNNGMAWLLEQSPAAAAAAEQFGWRDFCLGDATNDTARRAQFRDIYNAIAKRAIDQEKYRGLEAAGLRVLEGGKGPQKIGKLIQLVPPKGNDAA